MSQYSKPILFVQTAFLGDLILSVPLLKRVRELRPQSKIILVCRQGLGSLMKDLNLVDEFYEVKKNSRHSYTELQKMISGADFEWCISAHMSFRTAWLLRKISAEKKVGFKTWWNASFYPLRVEKNLKLPDAIRQMSLLSPLDPQTLKRIHEYPANRAENWNGKEKGVLRPVPEWASLQVPIPEMKAEFAYQERLSGPKVCVFPGSVWPTKRWTKSGYQEVVKELYHRGYQMIFLGSKDEQELCMEVSKGLQNPRVLAGRISLLETLSVIKASELVITNDSGGQHLASLVGTPVVSIFGPTVLSQGFRPWQNRAVVVQNKKLLCRPCGKHGHKKCPIGTHECMKGVLPEEVLAATNNFLA